MSTYKMVKTKCAICGKEHSFPVVISTSAIGFMDLDTRPPQMKRENLRYEIQMCDHCFYANDDISKLNQNFKKDILSSPAFLKVATDKSINNVAKAFLLAGHISAKCEQYKEAGIYFLNAAWFFDDLKEETFAKRARNKSLQYLSNYVESSENVNFAVLTVDLQRRIEDFEGAIATAIQLKDFGVGEYLEKILNLEIRLCQSRDSLCHTTEEVE